MMGFLICTSSYTILGTLTSYSTNLGTLTSSSLRTILTSSIVRTASSTVLGLATLTDIASSYLANSTITLNTAAVPAILVYIILISSLGNIGSRAGKSNSTEAFFPALKMLSAMLSTTTLPAVLV